MFYFYRPLVCFLVRGGSIYIIEDLPRFRGGGGSGVRVKYSIYDFPILQAKSISSEFVIGGARMGGGGRGDRKNRGKSSIVYLEPPLITI